MQFPYVNYFFRNSVISAKSSQECYSASKKSPFAYQMPKPTVEDDEVVTTRTAAEVLGVSVSTAQMWMESGSIPSWKTPGGHRRARMSDVLRVARVNASGVDPMKGLPAEFVPNQADSDPHSAIEPVRLSALHSSGLVDTPPEREFDRLTWLATRIADVPIALFSLITAERQWFKSRVGLAVSETPREFAFCSHAIMQREPFVVPNAAEDPRFKANPLVTGPPNIRFYAAFPVSTEDDLRLGTLCVIDRVPRTLSHDQMVALAELAAIASDEVRRRIVASI